MLSVFPFPFQVRFTQHSYVFIVGGGFFVFWFFPHIILACHHIVEPEVVFATFSSML